MTSTNKILAMESLKYGTVTCVKCKNIVTDSETVTLTPAIFEDTQVVQYTHTKCPSQNKPKVDIGYDDNFNILVVESLPDTAKCTICKNILDDGELINTGAVVIDNVPGLNHRHIDCMPDAENNIDARVKII